MKSRLLTTLALFLATSLSHADPTNGMKEGKLDLKSISVLTFGPEGILFAADPKGAEIVAMATGDTTKPEGKVEINVPTIGAKAAALLGTTADKILIEDLAVNPISRKAYISVSRGRGPSGQAVIVVADHDGKLSLLDLTNIKHSRAALPNAPEDKVRGQGRRRRNPRMEAITDLAFKEGKLIVAGLSNEEFASCLRSLAFPFDEKVESSSVRIYHGAHGKYETNSPIRTFLPIDIDGEANLLASYTCTPLVRVPVKELKNGADIQGTTIAELGNRNRPLDMIHYSKGGEEYVLMANSSRGIMKIKADHLGKVEGITERVSGIKGVAYETIEDWKGIAQLDRLGSDHALVLHKDDDGANLLTKALP